MTVAELLLESYAAAERHAPQLLVAAAVTPLFGAVAARIGKAGTTDADGRALASGLVALAALAVGLELCAVALGALVFDASLLQADARLVAAPLVFLAGTLAAVRLVFPLHELAAIRSLGELALLATAGGFTLWFLSQFRGWGIYFFGSFLQLLVVTALGGFFLYRLARRTFGGTDPERQRLR